MRFFYNIYYAAIGLYLQPRSQVKALDRNFVFDDKHRELITGGSNVASGTYPWFVQSQGSVLCGGSLVTPEFVLTAAHCNPEKMINFKVGSLCNEHYNCGQDYEVLFKQEVFTHPRWDGTGIHDLMLIKVEGRASSNPIAMDEDSVSSSYACNKKLWAIGMGDTAPGERPHNLQHIELTYLEQTECNKLYSTLAPDMMCTLDGAGKNICSGDSGGPLYDQTNNVLAGVVSWGAGACGRGNADVYSRIGYQVS